MKLLQNLKNKNAHVSLTFPTSIQRNQTERNQTEQNQTEQNQTNEPPT